MRTNKNKHSSKPRIFSSSNSSSSRSNCSSSSSSLPPQTPRVRSMEEVWRDLTFSPPPPPPPLRNPITFQNPNPNPNHDPSHHNPSRRGAILQDFLPGPFKEAPPPSSSAGRNEQFPLPLPPTALSLNSRLDLDYNSNSNGSDDGPANHNAPPPPPFVTSSAFSDAVMGSPPAVGLFSFCPPNKRVIESSSSIGGDRRHKRMMKNRESAARSRARKQAYTNELELEVAHLVAENEKLRKQYEELRVAMVAQHSTKKSLQRTLTAPF